MHFALDEQQSALAHALADFVRSKTPMSHVREAAASELGHDPDLWRALGDGLGVAGLLVPERFGGSGATLLDAAVVMEELGRGLVPTPFFATSCLAVLSVLALGSGDRAGELLGEVAAASTSVALATTEPGGDDSVRMRARKASGSVVISGTKVNVVDGHWADHLLVLAAAPGGGDECALYLVPGSAPGVQRVREQTLDLTRSLATVTFDDVQAEALGDPAPWTVWEATLDRIAVLVAAEMVGGSRAALDMAVEYAKVRRQFDRPIGSFQALKHRAAEMAVDLEASRVATWYAAWADFAGTADEFALAAPIALATTAAGFDFAASHNIQIHGGIGFTWEHDAHLYFRRAKADAALIRSVNRNWQIVADRIGV